MNHRSDLNFVIDTQSYLTTPRAIRSSVRPIVRAAVAPMIMSTVMKISTIIRLLSVA